MNCMDALKKVQSGDPLVIPAQTFNTFIDAARDFKARQLQQGRTSVDYFAEITFIRTRSKAH